MFPPSQLSLCDRLCPSNEDTTKTEGFSVKGTLFDKEAFLIVVVTSRILDMSWEKVTIFKIKIYIVKCY